MINKKIGVLLLFALFISSGAKTQRATSMRINEALVISEDNLADNYGKRHGQIELFSTSAGTVNIVGCYLTNDKNNPMKCPIPKGDVLTQVQLRQHTLFWADGQPGRGTSHVNFVLDPSKENCAALYDVDGKALIDEITIPADQLADISYGRVIDSEKDWAQLKKVTPGANNLTLDSNGKIDSFGVDDSLDIGMTITAMAVVFLDLFLLHITFKQIGKLSTATSKRNVEEAAGSASVAADAGQGSGEIFVVIATAPYEMNDSNHDIGNMVLIIHKVQRVYSLWSSKLYGLRQISQK